jgi:hypothetical protein
MGFRPRRFGAFDQVELPLAFLGTLFWYNREIIVDENLCNRGTEKIIPSNALPPRHRHASSAAASSFLPRVIITQSASDNLQPAASFCHG